jgi:PAS domain S-box-containing protein
MTVDHLSALLDAREEELSAIYENVPGIVFYIAIEPNGEFRFRSVSRDFLTATGLSRQQVVGSLVRDIIPPPSRDMVLNRYREAIRSGQPVRWEETSLYPTGQKYGEVAVTPLYDASGHATHLIGIVHDITERKRLEERRAEDLLEAAPDAMIVVDQAGRIILVNVQTERLFGYRREEILGRNEEFLVPPRFHERHQAHRIAFFSQSQPQIRPMGANLQLFGLRKDGTEFPVEISLSPIRTSEGILVTSAIRDITERKLAEEAVRESEEKFRSVFCEAGVGMVIVSPEGRFLAANRTFCVFLGYTEKELLEKTVESVTFSEDWPPFSQKLSQALREGYGFQWVQKRCLHKSGRIVYTETSASLIRSRNGSPQYFVAEVLDVTSRKEAEEALSAMTRKLIEAQEQERTRIGRELHDNINQRLAMLSLQLEELPEHPSEVQNRVQELRKETAEIANDVEALSHDLHSSKLEYLGAVAGMKSWCKELAQRQKIEIDFKNDVSNVLPREVGLSLFRVLQEALHNAQKHSGVKRIGVQLQEDSKEVHLVISDLGRGFDVEAASQGKGLGLTSMRERVRLMNGTISIESKPMGGTIVHVRVPLESALASQRAAGD